MPQRTFQTYFLLTILGVAGIVSFFILQAFLALMILAAVFAVVLYPVYSRIQTAFGEHDSLAALCTVLLAMALVLIPTTILGYQLLSESQQLYATIVSPDHSSVQQSIVALGPSLEHYIPGATARISEFSATLSTYTQTALSWVIQHLVVVFSGVAGVLFDTFLFFVILYYLLRDGIRLRKLVIKLSPLDTTDDEALMKRMRLAINSLVKGKIIVALCQGTLAGIGFAVFGVANPVLWGLVAALASFIPPFGTAMVLAPGVAYLVIIGHLAPAIGLAIWASLAVGTIDNFLGPYLMSEGMQLHPLLVLFSALGGIGFFGPLGVFLGPLALSLFIALLSMYSDGHTHATE
jgi:predicted PurR-regulated permease PerM